MKTKAKKRVAPKRLTPPKEQQFRVHWVIDVWATTFEDAAKMALKIQRDPESTATMFDVHRMNSRGLSAGFRTIDTEMK